jgi:hypothetical protein
MVPGVSREEEDAVGGPDRSLDRREGRVGKAGGRRKVPARLVERARLVLLSAEGKVESGSGETLRCNASDGESLATSVWTLRDPVESAGSTRR